MMTAVPSSEIEMKSQNGESDHGLSYDDPDSEGDSEDAHHSIHQEFNDDLTVLQAASLLTADILGTGLLALPQDIKVLGKAVGLSFLIMNLPLNWFAGMILSNAASRVERQSEEPKSEGDGVFRMTSNVESPNTLSDQKSKQKMKSSDGIMRIGASSKKSAYSSVHASEVTAEEDPETLDDSEEHVRVEAEKSTNKYSSVCTTDDNHEKEAVDNVAQLPNDGACGISNSNSEEIDTHDFIGMTQALFHHPIATRVVVTIFYTNIFLVLGDYILVMSHAVAAIVDICIPHAGLVASTLMLAFGQLRTMAHLGKKVTILSLGCLAVVVIQCLVAGERQEVYQPPSDTSFLRRLSAMASIAFATGSNKLLLNIRREMKHRDDSPKSLAISSVVFGAVYVAISVLAGPNPPPFLFDSIPSGAARKFAGLLLWIHVAVSYAINSQAICASIDRRFFQHFAPSQHPRKRWLTLTLCLTISSYLVANMVPFFKDLVALIGALTSVPLTLLLPAILYRRAFNIPMWRPTRSSLASYGLGVFGVVVLIGGLAGSIGSIELDWENNGHPFSCTL